MHLFNYSTESIVIVTNFLTLKTRLAQAEVGKHSRLKETKKEEIPRISISSSLKHSSLLHVAGPNKLGDNS